MRRYLNINTLPALINSPFRQDKSPSLSFWRNHKGSVFYTDFGTKETGSIYTFLSKYWGKTFYETLEIIVNDFDMNSPDFKPTRKESKRKNTDLKVKVRNWEAYDETYWNSYGISIELLKKVNVFPISHFIISQQTFKADKHAYVFVEHKDSIITIKIYQPYNTHLKWLTSHNKSVISLWTFLPPKGDVLCVCASVKDALCLYQNTGIPAIALQGEGYFFKDSVTDIIKERFKTVYILFDNDETGIRCGQQMAEKTGFIYKELPQFKDGKDVSDMYKSLGLQNFKQIILNLLTT